MGFVTLQREDSTSPVTDLEEGSVEIAVAAHYLDLPHSLTPRIEELISPLPSWVTAIGWTSLYTSWIF